MTNKTFIPISDYTSHCALNGFSRFELRPHAENDRNWVWEGSYNVAAAVVVAAVFVVVVAVVAVAAVV